MTLAAAFDATEEALARMEGCAPGERALYESVKFIQNLLNDRSLDLREPGDLESIISKTTLVVN